MSGFGDILRDLVGRHGGEAAFTPVTMSIARSLAALLEQPGADPMTARTVIELERLLPTAGEARPLCQDDLDRMSDGEIEALHAAQAAILRIRSGSPLPDEPAAPEVEPEQHSARWFAAVALADRLDEISESGLRCGLGDEEIGPVLGMVTDVLTIGGVFPPLSSFADRLGAPELARLRDENARLRANLSSVAEASVAGPKSAGEAHEGEPQRRGASPIMTRVGLRLFQCSQQAEKVR